jgi:hypothetical protein
MEIENGRYLPYESAGSPVSVYEGLSYEQFSMRLGISKTLAQPLIKATDLEQS